MTATLARAVMALSLCCMTDRRGAWAAAMRAEFDVASADGKPLRFAAGCLFAACRELATLEEGRFALTSYALALGLMIPMAALQVGCALFGLPYLYPGQAGLAGAWLVGGEHEGLIRGVYQAAVPSIALLLLVLGVGHLSIAWAMLNRDWNGVRRRGALLLAAAVTLVVFMGVFFLDSRQAATQGAILAVELATVWLIGRWHDQLFPAAAESPG